MGKTNGQIAVTDLLANETGNEIAVAGDSTVAYTETFPCKNNVNYAFEYEFESGGTVNAKIEIEQGNEPPATEGAASSNFVVPEDAAAFDDSVVDEDTHIKAYSPAVARFLRGKITGLTGNAASTKLVKFKVCTEVNL
jgi:hypothetical protein